MLFLDRSVAHVFLPYRMMHTAWRTHLNMLTSSSHKEVIDAKIWWHTLATSTVKTAAFIDVLELNRVNKLIILLNSCGVKPLTLRIYDRKSH